MKMWKEYSSRVIERIMVANCFVLLHTVETTRIIPPDTLFLAPVQIQHRHPCTYTCIHTHTHNVYMRAYPTLSVLCVCLFQWHQDHEHSARLLSATSFLESQPTRQPFGKDGSSSGGNGTSPKLHWHSCVTKLGDTVNGKPSSSAKNSCAGILH